MTTDTTTIPTSRATRSADEQLFADTAGLRRSAVWRKARWIPDASAAVDAAVWEAIVSGVSDWQTLYDVARYAAVAQRRYETRHRRRPPGWRVVDVDPSERAIEMVDATLTVRQLSSALPPPSAAVFTWADRKTGATGSSPLSSRVKMAGNRWVAKARAELGVTDGAA